MKAIKYICAVLFIAVFYPIWSGYALSILWGWFIVPVLGMPDLSVPYAAGIMACVVPMMMKSSYKPLSEKDLLNTIGRFDWYRFHALKPACALLVGWVLHQFC